MSNLKDETSYMSPALCKRRFFVGTSSLRHPFAFAILSPSPSTKTAFLVDEPPFCLHHPPKRRFWWMGHGRSPSKSADLPCQDPISWKDPSEAPGSGAAMLSLRRVF